MSFALWILTGVVACIAFRHHLWVIAALILATRLLVPMVAGELLLGSFSQLHPASWWALVAFGFLVLLRAPLLGEELRSKRGVYLLLGLLLAATAGITLLARPMVNVWGITNTLVTAVLFFILVRCALRDNGAARVHLTRLFVMIGVAQSLLGILQILRNDAILFTSFRTAAFWFDPDRVDRALGTADSPLDLSLILLVAVPLTPIIRRLLPRLLCIGILGVGVFLTESRVGLVAYLLLVLVMTLASKLPSYAKVFSLVVLPAVAFFALRTELASGTLERFANDSGSALARQKALDYFFSRAEESAFVGGGFGSSFDARTTGQLTTSLESSYLMFYVDFGVLLALLLALVLLALLARALRGPLASTAGLAAAGAALLVASYSGFMTQGSASLVLWFSLAIATPVVAPFNASEPEGVARRARAGVGSPRPRSPGRRPAPTH